METFELCSFPSDGPRMRLPAAPTYLILLTFLFIARPVAAEWRDIPYEDVAKMPLALKAADPQGIYTATYKVVPAEGKSSLPTGLQFQVKTGQQLVPVVIEPDGKVDFPIRKDWFEDGASIQVNQPKG